MKSVFLILCLCLSISANAQTPQTYTTVNGSEFHLVPGLHPDLDPAYQDSSGLIWGRLGSFFTADNRSITLVLTQADALDYCHHVYNGTKTARLPTALEFLRLREAMSSVPRPESEIEVATGISSYNPTFDFRQPALPNFEACVENDRTKNPYLSLWSQTVSPIDPEGSDSFYPCSGYVVGTGFTPPAAVTANVRCVVDP